MLSPARFGWGGTIFGWIGIYYRHTIVTRIWEILLWCDFVINILIILFPNDFDYFSQLYKKNLLTSHMLNCMTILLVLYYLQSFNYCIIQTKKEESMELNCLEKHWCNVCVKLPHFGCKNR